MKPTTHRGDVYVRKNADSAPKIKINSQLDLKHLVQGCISLDIVSNNRFTPNLIHWKYVKDPWSLGNKYRVPTNRPSIDAQAHDSSYVAEPVLNLY